MALKALRLQSFSVIRGSRTPSHFVSAHHVIVGHDQTVGCSTLEKESGSGRQVSLSGAHIDEHGGRLDTRQCRSRYPVCLRRGRVTCGLGDNPQYDWKAYHNDTSDGARLMVRNCPGANRPLRQAQYASSRRRCQPALTSMASGAPAVTRVPTADAALLSTSYDSAPYGGSA